MTGKRIELVDDGCAEHPHCLTCPLPRCVYDEPEGHTSPQIIKAQARAIAIRSLFDDGLTVKAISERLVISRRTVHRALEGKE